MKKLFVLGLALFVWSFGYTATAQEAQPQEVKDKNICPMHASPNANSEAKTEKAQVKTTGDHQEVANDVSTHVHGQDPGQEQQQDPDDSQEQQPQPHQPSEGAGCSRPDPKDPDKGVEPNTVGCSCDRKLPCSNGGPQEDPGSPEDNFKTRCKNWCHGDRCHCPNPCKS